MILDTYRDRQNGFVFGTNPAGIEYDGQVTNEGQGGGGLAPGQMQTSGSGGGFNINWDGAWTVKALIDEGGWVGRVRDPVQDPAVPVGDRPGLGRQLPAQHPAAQRTVVLGADPAAVQPLPALARRVRSPASRSPRSGT